MKRTLDRETVKQAIRECKKVAGLTYAYSTAPEDCMSCSNYAIVQKHGENAKGIWLKWYRVGMNASKWERSGCTHCIAHDLTESQAKKVVEVLSKYFKVDWNGDNSRCIDISAKEVA